VLGGWLIGRWGWRSGGRAIAEVRVPEAGRARAMGTAVRRRRGHGDGGMWPAGGVGTAVASAAGREDGSDVGGWRCGAAAAARGSEGGGRAIARSRAVLLYKSVSVL
jgi:hypothetical protein